MPYFLKAFLDSILNKLAYIDAYGTQKSILSFWVWIGTWAIEKRVIIANKTFLFNFYFLSF